MKFNMYAALLELWSCTAGKGSSTNADKTG